MFEHDLFKLNASVADALKSIKSLKNLYVGLQQYEHSAKLRDIEKQLETVEKALPYYGSPIPSPRLNQGGELFFRELFTYADLNCWSIPEIFTNAFKARKAKLNDSIEFSDESIKHLTNLNQKLAAEESRVIEFLNFLNNTITAKGINESLNELTAGNITIKCYTNNSKYAYSHANFDHQNPFYLFKLSANNLLSSLSVYYETNKTDNTPETDFSRSLPLNFMDEKICSLFFTLGNDGLLAWEDFLNVERMEMDLDVRYQFTTLNSIA